MKLLRYIYRVPLLLLHVIAGVLLAILLLNPVVRRLFSRSPESRLIPWWSRLFLRIFGVRLRILGTFDEPVALVVANHLSWLDIVVLHSARLMAFVAKAEIRRWPLVGWMASRAGTIYHRRGSPDSLRAVSEAMERRLENGWSAALFPEGRVGDGKTILPFHGRLFQCAVATGKPVKPVALRYVESDGSINTSTPFRRREPFLANLFRLMGRSRTVAELHFCPSLDSVKISARRALAQESRRLIVEALENGGKVSFRNDKGAVHDYTPNSNHRSGDNGASRRVVGRAGRD